jgi:hypothetical protein
MVVIKDQKQTSLGEIKKSETHMSMTVVCMCVKSLLVLSLPENSALPCAIPVRQRGQNAWQRLCRASTLGNEGTAVWRTATHSLPCIVPYTHGKGLCRAKLALPCVLSALPCHEALPCVGKVAVRAGFAVRYDPLPSA